MRSWILPSSLLLVALCAPPAAFACGEGIYTVPKESRHQGFLAQRPAKVLIYNNQASVPESTKAVYRGLVHAGHKLEVARDPAQLATALRDRRYDVVIANNDQIDIIGKQVEPASRTRLLPIASGGRRNPGTGERSRFALAQDASLTQYLRLIDRLVKDAM